MAGEVVVIDASDDRTPDAPAAQGQDAAARRSWRVPTALLAGTAVVAFGAWVWWDSPRGGRADDGAAVRFSGTGEFGISLPSTKGGAPYSIGGIPLCRGDVDAAEVVAVSADDQGLVVTDFAVRPPTLSVGADQIALDETDFGSGTSVTAPCSEDRSSELGVEFTKPADTTARTEVLLVEWRAGDRTGVVHIPMHLVLCEHPDQDVPECLAY